MSAAQSPDVPPYDLEVEASVLAALLDGTRQSCMVPFLRPEHFYAERHRRILEAIHWLEQLGARVDRRSVLGRLHESKRLGQIGGPEYLTEIRDNTPALIERQFVEHARLIEKKARRRRLLAESQRLVARCYQDDTDDAVLEEAPLLIAEAVRAPPEPEDGILNATAIAAELPDQEYLVPALGIPLGGGAPHIVGGYGFAGKTLLMQAALLATAAGRSWWGVYGCARGTAVHFDGEQGERLTRRRYQRLAIGAGIDLADLGDALRLISMPDLRLTDANAEARLCRLLTGVRMALFDSFRAFCPGLDENDARARAPLDMLGRVSAITGTSIFVVHHARKARDGDNNSGKYTLRGSSALFDACDVVLCLSAAKGEPTVISQEKARSHGELAPDFCVRVDDVAVADAPRAGLRVAVLGTEALHASRALKEADQRRVLIAKLGPRILDAVDRATAEGKPLTSQDDLATTLGVRLGSVRMVVSALIEAGALEKQGKRGPFFRSRPNPSESVPDGSGDATAESVRPSPPLGGRTDSDGSAPAAASPVHSQTVPDGSPSTTAPH